MQITSAIIALCLAAGTLARTVENGKATHWYSTGQPGPCHGPAAPAEAVGPAYTVGISPVFNETTLCGTWVVVNNTKNPDIEPLRASVTTTCTTCGETDLSLGMFFYEYLSNSTIYTEPESIDIEWYFCDVGGKEC